MHSWRAVMLLSGAGESEARGSMTTKIVETAKFDLKNPILIEGFPGLGLIGTIAATYLVDKLGMEPLGYITSDKFPPIAAIHNNIPLHPARIYKSRKHNIVVLFSEFIIPLNSIYPLSEAILEWAQGKGISKIISLGGITIKGEQDEVFGIASSSELVKLLNSHGIKTIREGATTGVNGVLLAECASRGFPAMSLLAEAKQNYMDPKGAALVIEALKRVTGLELDTRELEKESAELEKKMTDMFSKAKDASRHYKATGEELGAMYG